MFTIDNFDIHATLLLATVLCFGTRGDERVGEGNVTVYREERLRNARRQVHSVTLEGLVIAQYGK